MGEKVHIAIVAWNFHHSKLYGRKKFQAFEKNMQETFT